MAVERPTFHESWHRVGGLRPRLRPTVQVVRQVFRGRPWHVVQDAGGKDYFRMDASAYAFVGLLDGRRTVDECWQACCESLGDDAPTQGEVVQLLGQLYGSNLLAAEVEGETDVLLRRQRRRSMRELQGVVTNLLFLRLPLLDPDQFLERSAWMVRPLLTKAGAAAWVALVAAGLWAVAGRFGELSTDAASLLSADNLGLLYLTFAGLKLIHELGHGYACKIMGLREGRGREQAREDQTHQADGHVQHDTGRARPRRGRGECRDPRRARECVGRRRRAAASMRRCAASSPSTCPNPSATTSPRRPHRCTRASTCAGCRPCRCT